MAEKIQTSAWKYMFIYVYIYIYICVCVCVCGVNINKHVKLFIGLIPIEVSII